MRIRIVGALTFAGVLLVGLVPSVAAINPSCTAQFASSTARATTPFGPCLSGPTPRHCFRIRNRHRIAAGGLPRHPGTLCSE